MSTPKWEELSATPPVKWDDLSTEQPKTNKNALTDTVHDVGIGTMRIPSAVTGLADIPFGLAGFDRPISKAAESLGEMTGFQPGKWADQAEQSVYSPERQQSNQNVQQAWQDFEKGDKSFLGALGETVSNPRSLAGNVVQSLPSMVAGGAAGKALSGGSKIAGALGEGLITAGQQMDQVNPEADPQKAALTSLAAGVGTGLIGYGGSKIANKLGVLDPDTLLSTGVGTTARQPLSLGKRIGYGAAQEGLFEELPQSLQEQALQNVAEDKPLTEGLAQAGVTGTLAGGLMGGGLNILRPTNDNSKWQTPGYTYKGEGIAGPNPQWETPSYTGPLGKAAQVGGINKQPTTENVFQENDTRDSNNPQDKDVIKKVLRINSLIQNSKSDSDANRYYSSLNSLGDFVSDLFTELHPDTQQKFTDIYNSAITKLNKNDRANTGTATEIRGGGERTNVYTGTNESTTGSNQGTGKAIGGGINATNIQSPIQAETQEPRITPAQRVSPTQGAVSQEVNNEQANKNANQDNANFTNPIDYRNSDSVQFDKRGDIRYSDRKAERGKQKDKRIQTQELSNAAQQQEAADQNATVSAQQAFTQPQEVNNHVEESKKTRKTSSGIETLIANINDGYSAQNGKNGHRESTQTGLGISGHKQNTRKTNNINIASREVNNHESTSEKTANANETRKGQEGLLKPNAMEGVIQPTESSNVQETKATNAEHQTATGLSSTTGSPGSISGGYDDGISGNRAGLSKIAVNGNAEKIQRDISENNTVDQDALNVSDTYQSTSGKNKKLQMDASEKQVSSSANETAGQMGVSNNGENKLQQNGERHFLLSQELINRGMPQDKADILLNTLSQAPSNIDKNSLAKGFAIDRTDKTNSHPEWISGIDFNQEYQANAQPNDVSTARKTTGQPTTASQVGGQPQPNDRPVSTEGIVKQNESIQPQAGSKTPKELVDTKSKREEGEKETIQNQSGNEKIQPKTDVKQPGQKPEAFNNKEKVQPKWETPAFNFPTYREIQRQEERRGKPWTQELYNKYHEAAVALVGANAQLAIDDKNTVRHENRVAASVAILSKKLGLSKAQVARATVASLGHDLGKRGMKSLIEKHEPLTPDEFGIIRSHPELTKQIMREMGISNDIIKTASEHHETTQGGYPEHGERPDFTSQVVQTADIADSLIGGKDSGHDYPLRFDGKELPRTVKNVVMIMNKMAFSGELNKEVYAAYKKMLMQGEIPHAQKLELERNGDVPWPIVEHNKLLNKVEPKAQPKQEDVKFSKAAKTLKAEKTVVDEDGVHYETGVPVTFNYIHNTESATKIYGKPKKDSGFGRYFEPSGQYMIAVGRFPSEQRKGMEYGTVTFNNPLVVNNDSLNWKQQLSESFGNKHGKNLSQALIDAGYDGVVTTDNGHTSEILNLTNFDKSKAKYSRTQSTTGSTVEQVKSRLPDELKGIQAIDMLKIITKQQASDMFSDPKQKAEASTAQGFYTNSVSYFVADNIGGDTDLLALGKHEIAVHALKLGLDDPEFQSLLKQVERMRNNGQKDVVTAQRYMETFAPKTKKEIKLEETLAYLVQHNPGLPVVKRFIAWFKATIRKLGRMIPVLQRGKFIKWANNLSVEDLVYMADSALKNAYSDLMFDGNDNRTVFSTKAIPETITINGKERPTRNSNDQLIHPTEEGIKNFYKWFGDSKVIDEQGRPMVVYHETDADFSEFRIVDGKRSKSDGEMPTGAFFKPSTKQIGVTNKNSLQMPVFLALKNPLVARNRMHLVSIYSSEIPGYKETIEKENEINRKWKADPRTDWAVDTEEQQSIFDDAIAQWDAEIDDNVLYQKKLINSYIKQKEYDGLMLKEDAGSLGRSTETFVAISPGQIKSAIGNTGEFSQYNPDIRYSFAGEKAETANQLRLANAKKLLAAGEDKETVRQETGWFKGVDGKWRFEIDDSRATTKGIGTFGQVYKTKGDNVTIGDMIRHTRLFAAYPAFENADVRLLPENSDLNGNSGFSKGKPYIAINGKLDNAQWLSTMLHEIQHLAQIVEGFASGGSEKSIIKDILSGNISDEYMRKIALNTVEKISNKNGYKLTKSQKTDLAEQVFLWDNSSDDKVYSIQKSTGLSEEQIADFFVQDTFEMYLRLAGEIEARNVQTRQDMTDEERGMMRPDLTQDIQDADAIVVFNNRVMNSDIRYSVSAPTWAKEFANTATDKIRDHITTSKTFSALNNSFNTQAYKAWKDKDYKPVFDESIAFEQDIAKNANEAADLAPSLLPKLEGLIESAREVIKGYQRMRDAKAVGKAIFDTTQQNKKLMSYDQLKQAGLNDNQITMYQEFFAAVNKSLDDLVKSELYRAARALKLKPASQNLTPRQAANYYVQQIESQPAGFFDEDAQKLAKEFTDKVDQIDKLKREGYAPLQRFGQYTVNVQKEGKSDPEYFGMYETEAEANEDYRLLKEEYPDAVVTRGIMSQEDWQMFKGVTPETMETFAKLMGIDQEQAFQDYLKIGINNRSALKRLIHRKGTKGYVYDPQRVLATFITSNARMASKNLHMGEMLDAISRIPKEKGDVKDEAVELYNYVQNPAAAGAAVRGALFSWYLGGSVAAAAVNLTQNFTTTYPALHQIGSAKQVALELGRAMKLAANPEKLTGDIKTALNRAAEEGVTEPQELHMLYGESMRTGFAGMLKPLRPIMNFWGKFFSIAEAYNRRVAFIAAYNIAKQNGKSNPFKVAEQMVQDTQFIYSKTNRPDWARGAVGSTVFTFKMFTINYLEFLKKMPIKERSIALGVLLLLAGASGAPGSDDLDDLIDTIGQSLGYNTNAKGWKEQHINKYILYGMSSVLPIDISSRVGVQNVIPGTALLKRSESNKMRDIMEIAGPAGSLGQKIVNAFDAASGRQGIGAKIMAAKDVALPKALSDLAKAYDMAETGMYRDSNGKNITDISAGDIIAKGIGFQPSKVAETRRPEQNFQQEKGLTVKVEGEIASLWADGVFEKDRSKVEEAKALLKDWNEKNPKTPIRVNMQQIMKRVREMRKTSTERLINSSPRELRKYGKEYLK